MTIHELAKKLGCMSGVAIGRGPVHPTDPYLRYADQIDEYFASRPYLTDAGYIQFLRSYAGAWGETPEWELWIHGFYFTCPFLEKNYGHRVYNIHPITEKGFVPSGDIPFAEITFRDRPPHLIAESYFFNKNTNGEPGIYVQRVFMEPDTSSYTGTDYILTYTTFVELLQTFIDKKGRMWE